MPFEQKILYGAVYFGFALLLALATAPVWSHIVYGFNPTFDMLLEIRCGAAQN